MILETIKSKVGKLTGLGHPSPEQLGAALRNRKANAVMLADDGLIPNNPKLPLILYRSVVSLKGSFDPAALFEDLFEINGWSGGWRDGIYDFLHYHSQTHEVLGIARGSALVEFGGPGGKRIAVKAGDVVVLPAGTGHKRLEKSDDLLVVGAYPETGKYDELRASKEEHDRAVKAIRKVSRPMADPIYGKNGPLLQLWP
ncbi:MAG TPA: cupin [Alphaproteobacteria bacterium]|jgi:uncharacterized protein YjlB|nr:cupin [Alphaproteobacteria bacterium]